MLRIRLGLLAASLVPAAAIAAQSSPPAKSREQIGDQHPVREVHAQERPHRGSVRGPHDADRRRRGGLPRRVEERDTGAHGLRAHVRARDVHRLGTRPVRHARPLHRRRRRQQQRPDVLRLDALLGDRSVQLSRDHALARVGSHGLSPRLARRDEVQGPARHREERTAPEQRQPTVRARRRGHKPRAVPEQSSAFLARHRRHERPHRRVGRRRQAILPPVLRAEQRHARHRRRHRQGADQGLGRRNTSPTCRAGKPIVRPKFSIGRRCRAKNG